MYINNRNVENLDPNDPLEVTYERAEAWPEVPTPRTHPELCKIKGHGGGIVNGIPRLGYMRGGKSAIWDDETMCDVFLEKALEFIETHKEDPFFLYYAFHEPHAPRIPHPRFAGSTDMGPRGDVIIELDWLVGQVLDKLEELGLRDDTLVIFSSDNGPVLFDAYEDNSIELAGDHKPAGPLRGGKYSSYDGGTRVPFILSYPREVETGDLAPGHEFSMQLVPTVAADVFLHGRILPRRTVETPAGTFRSVVECVYLIDAGVYAVTDEFGGLLGYAGFFSYGTVAYSPDTGPVASYERAAVPRSDTVLPGFGDFDFALTGWERGGR